MKKITMIIIALVCILVLSVGTSFAAGQVAQKNAISAENARNFAYVDAGVSAKDATVTKTEFDYDDGKYVYEIEFVAGNKKYDYDINASNGKVLKKEVEQVRSTATAKKTQKAKATKANKTTKATTAAAKANGQISVDKAKNIALKHAGLAAKDVTFNKTKLEKDDGRWIYDIEFYVYGQNEYDYEIDAATGTILEAETDEWELYDD